MAIPKIIHYCWFGGNTLPELAKKCIESWRRFCPDYEIIEWNEKNYDISKAPIYVKQAYEAKKYAFVSDFARFDILYKYGGLYFDTDVELIKPIDDIVSSGSFMGCETDGAPVECENEDYSITVASGLGIGAEPQMELYSEIIEYYKSVDFYDESGNRNTLTVVDYVTDILKKNGLKNTNVIQNVSGINIYPKEFFCPKEWWTGEMKITENTVSIHHYDDSWGSDESKYMKQLQQRLRKILPASMAVRFALAVSLLKFHGVSGLKKAIIKNDRK